VTTGDDAADSTLAARAGKGDEQAFAELVRRHKHPLYRLVRRYVGEPEEAYDAVQEAFIAAWAAIGRYDPERPFLSWLRTIAINKARDRSRRLAFRRLIFCDEGLGRLAQARPDPETMADERLIERQKLASLGRAIAKLPQPLKEALLLTAFEGLSQQEAGKALGVSAKTIETRAYRARKTLARTLEPHLPDA
jgi:RNA polymerase sigma-70 factor (ECF subfamily)